MVNKQMVMNVDRNMRILCVDDFAMMRRIVKQQLNGLGFSYIEEADDGLSALPLLEEGRFDFVVTDWNMPGMTGFELLKKIRSSPQLKDLPVLMVTAEAKREQIVAAAQAGVNGYIVKPFTPKTLEAKIQKIFKR